MVNPNEMALILVIYLVFVLKLGPIFMERRPPFPIKGFLVVYNAIKAAHSIILVFKVRILFDLVNNQLVSNFLCRTRFNFVILSFYYFFL